MYNDCKTQIKTDFYPSIVFSVRHEYLANVRETAP